MQKYILLTALAVLSLISCKQKTADSSADNININPSDTINMNTESVSDDASLYLLIGTYTTGESEGIYVYQFDTVSGYSKYKNMAKITNPSYLTISKDGKYVYAVSETGDAKAAANAFIFDKVNGSLKLLNSQLTGGADPCYIEMDNTGKHIVTANYSGGSVTAFNVNQDGTLAAATQLVQFTGKGSDPDRQKAPHLHCVRYSPDAKYLFADDLGTDKIHKFEVNSNEPGNYLKLGTPAAFDVAAGSGPRHLDFHPNGKYAYLINEISGTVIAFKYNAGEGNLTEIQSIQADTLGAKGSADIHVSPDGKFLYASNRLKGDGIAIFSINEGDGKLTKVGYQETGVHPRNFIITPNGKFLLVASRDDDAVQVFLIDRATGLLENTYKDIELDMPVCLKFTSFR